jgi:acetylornithine deacetylase/succinyl-diaminopimelate desuccinylase-like protein
VIEGEEEVASENLERFLVRNAERCRSDIAVISDTSQFGPDLPAITYGLRGVLTCEVILRGAQQDLHSGVYGGSVANPVNALARIIAALHDDQRRVLIPGFYDDVRPLDVEERRRLSELPFDDSESLRALAWGEVGFTTLERRWVRPTCDVNGIIGGYTGVGPKTIIPARASAKISCRLVPEQNPISVAQALEACLRARCPAGIQLEFVTSSRSSAIVCDTNTPFMRAARIAIRDAFGRDPLLIREGGSIPVVEAFRRLLGLDTLLLGWGQNTDNLHAPNERFLLKDFHRGIRASALFFDAVSNGGTS